jgi:hypothetical protein
VTRDELANWLCANVQRRRLERIGESVPGASALDAREFARRPLDGLPDDERRNWLDMADAVLELQGDHQPVERLQELGRDWIRYTMQLHDPEWRDEMRRAVIVEMRFVVDQLEAECRR